MDFRKINSYVILLTIVVVVGLLVSMAARFVILAKGVDTGTANLVFLIMLGICAIVYLTIMATFSSIADFFTDKILPKVTRKKPPVVVAENCPHNPIPTLSRSSRMRTNDISNDRESRSTYSNAMRTER